MGTESAGTGLNGEWTGTHLEISGVVQQTGDEEVVWQFDRYVVRFRAPGTDAVMQWAADDSRSPGHVNFYSTDASRKLLMAGLYQIVGDELVVCLNFEGGERPTELATSKTSGYMLFKLTRKR